MAWYILSTIIFTTNTNIILELFNNIFLVHHHRRSDNTAGHSDDVPSPEDGMLTDPKGG